MQFVSLCAFGLAALLAIAFGVRYLGTREFMPYHAEVLGQPWSELAPRLQAIILGMLKVAGSGLLGCGCALLWLLLPLSRGESWAAWAAVTTFLVSTGPILYVVLWLRRIAPGAKTPVAPTLAAMVLVLIGALAFLAAPA
jgi:ABC-type polysaccharide/polyol phosphate export permease